MLQDEYIFIKPNKTTKSRPYSKPLEPESSHVEYNTCNLDVPDMHPGLRTTVLGWGQKEEEINLVFLKPE